MKTLNALCAAVILAFVSPSSAQAEDFSKDIEALRAAVSQLSEKVSTLEQLVQTHWSCTAMCGDFYAYKYVYGEGANAAKAFAAMESKCPPSMVLFAGTQTVGGQTRYLPATVAASCTK